MPHRTWLLMCVTCLVVGIAYLPGLHGPVLLDDVPNLGPIVEWAQGESPLNPLLAERKSGPLGRPVALLSFMGNALTTGGLTWPMKLTNILLHLATGLALFGLLQQLLLRDARLSSHARLLAFGTSALWLALPQHVVTVLYTVQRMTVLAALFSVLALWCYAIARERMDQHPGRAIVPLLGSGVLAVLAVLSKESALVFPLLLVIVEWAFYPPPEGGRRPRLARLVALGAGILPITAAVAWLAWHPGIVLDAYGNRDFSIGERVLTQSRIVWEYAYSTFLPLSRTSNVYNDAYVLSTGVFDPPATALALLGWILVCLILWHLRRHKTIVAGALLFLAGHALESTIFPLEMYFVHRNYLPSMGLALIALVLAYLLWQRAANRFHHPVRMAMLSGTTILLVISLSTASRAHLWGSEDRLLVHAEIHTPESLRLRTDRLRIALESGNFDTAQREIQTAYRAAPVSERRTVRMWDIFSHCRLAIPAPPGKVEALASEPAARITNYANIAMFQLRSSIMSGQCKEMDRATLAHIIADWAEHSPQSPNHRNVWEARAIAAVMYADAGQAATASELAKRAFIDSGNRFELGEFAFMLAMTTEDRHEANEIIEQLKKNANPNDRNHADLLLRLQEILRSDAP